MTKIKNHEFMETELYKKIIPPGCQGHLIISTGFLRFVKQTMNDVYITANY
jgi:hypothetical protein